MQQNATKKLTISLNNIIELLIPLYFCSVFVFSFNTAENNVISRLLALALIGVLVLYILHKNKAVLDWRAMLLWGFLLFCLLSCLWAWDIGVAFSKCISLFQIILLAYLVYNYISSENKLEYFIACLCIATTFFSIYTVLYVGVDTYFTGIEEGDRLGMEIANVNTIGRWSAVGAIINLWYAFYKKKRICIAFLIVCGLVTLGSESRTAIAGLLFGLVVLLFSGTDTKKSVQGFALLILFAIVLVLVIQLPMFESVRERFTVMFETFLGEHSGGSTDLRLKMIELGLNEFYKAPLSGIGIGNSAVLTLNEIKSATYLHNNYAELLASVGLIGTMLYYSCYIVPVLIMTGKKWRSNPLVALARTILIMLMFCHFGTVIYSEKMDYMIIILGFLITRETVAKERNKGVQST